MASARPTQPYQIAEIETSDFLNFKDLSKTLKHFDVTEEGEPVKWTKLPSNEVHTCWAKHHKNKAQLQRRV